MFFNRKRKKILVIDDDSTLRRQVNFRLKNFDGFEVIESDNGESGLDMAKEHDPDFIILDWILPKIQGDRVLSLLRKGDKTKNTPILILTVKNKIGDIENAFKLGASSYLTKPFSLRKLSEKIGHLQKLKFRKS